MPKHFQTLEIVFIETPVSQIDGITTNPPIFNVLAKLEKA
jgi:hypothetical protein